MLMYLHTVYGTFYFEVSRGPAVLRATNNYRQVLYRQSFLAPTLEEGIHISQQRLQKKIVTEISKA